MDKIRVTVNIAGHLKDLYPHLDAQMVIESERALTVDELIARLQISSRMVLFAAIDNRIVEKTELLESSCEINLVSPPAGG